jgi:hypothetical protein
MVRAHLGELIGPRPYMHKLMLMQVLQEIASARRILIVCGGMEINGHAFCSGLIGLNISESNHPGLQGVVRSVAYLIRGAIFRPKRGVVSAGRVSLGELIDMYHNRKATVRHDRVYALLSMSSDDPSASGLSPNYTLPWKTLFRKLIKHLFHKASYVEILDEREIALIKSKGCVVGQVSSVTSDTTRYDRQQVKIDFKNTAASVECKKRWGTQWALQALAKPIQQGDIVCLLEGASKPTILRTSHDYLYVIAIAVAPLLNARGESKKPDSQWSFQSPKNSLRQFLLVWNWNMPLKSLQEPTGHEISMEDYALVLQCAKGTPENRLYDMAVILKDVEEYEDASKKIAELLKGTEATFANDHNYQLVNREIYALTCKRAKKWKDAEETLVQVTETRRQKYGVNHPDTLDNIAHLVSVYIGQSPQYIQELGAKQNIATLVRENANITQTELIWVSKFFDKEVLALLLSLGSEKVVITEEVVKAAAANQSHGRAVMTLLLNQRGADIRITEEVVKAAARNHNGKAVVALLLSQRGTDVQVTEEVVKAAAGNPYNSEAVIALFLGHSKVGIQVTENVVKATSTTSQGTGKEAMLLLLSQRGADAHITERVAAAIMRNCKTTVVELLLNKHGADFRITEEVVKAAAGNWGCGTSIMRLLLSQRGADIKITEEVVKAAAANEAQGEKVLALLLHQRGAEVRITEEVMKAAAGNLAGGKAVMKLLLDQRRGEAKITEDVAKANAGSVNGSYIISGSAESGYVV